MGGRPSTKSAHEFLLKHGMARNDSDNGIGNVCIAGKIKNTFHREDNMGNVTQQGCSSHQSFFARRFHPGFRRRPDRQADVNFVRTDAFDDCGKLLKRLFRVIQPLDQHHFQPQPSAISRAEGNKPLNQIVKSKRRMGTIDGAEKPIVASIQGGKDGIRRQQLFPDLPLGEQRSVGDHGDGNGGHALDLANHPPQASVQGWLARSHKGDPVNCSRLVSIECGFHLTRDLLRRKIVETDAGQRRSSAQLAIDAIPVASFERNRINA